MTILITQPTYTSLLVYVRVYTVTSHLCISFHIPILGCHKPRSDDKGFELEACSNLELFKLFDIQCSPEHFVLTPKYRSLGCSSSQGQVRFDNQNG